MTRFRTLLLALLAVAVASCSGGGEAQDDAPFEVPGEPVATNEVTLPQSYRFEPAVIEITPGTTVTWTNEDQFPHNVHLLDGSETTEDLPIGSSASITFDGTDTVYYECSLHPTQMHGKIIVSA